MAIADARTELSVHSSAGVETLLVDASPDVEGAAVVRMTLDRVVWQRLAPDGQHGQVAGVRRRRPAFVTVGPGTALALLADGVPTVVMGEATR